MFNDKLRKAADEGKLDNNPGFKAAVEGDAPPKKEKYLEGDVVPSSTRGSMRDFIKRKRDMGKI